MFNESIENKVVGEILDSIDNTEKLVKDRVEDKEVKEYIKKKLKEIKELVEKKEYEEALEKVLELMEKLKKMNPLKYAGVLKALEVIADKIEKAIIVKEKIKKYKGKELPVLTLNDLLRIEEEMKKENIRKQQELEKATAILTTLAEHMEKEKEKVIKDHAIGSEIIRQEEEEKKKKEKEEKEKRERAVQKRKLLNEPPKIIRAPRAPKPPM